MEHHTYLSGIVIAKAKTPQLNLGFELTGAFVSQVLAQSPPRGIPGSAESWGVIRHGLFQHQFTSDSGGSF